MVAGARPTPEPNVASAARSNDAAVILSLEGVTKRFPGVLALDRVSLTLRRGEVHAICGENGAGKSTLMKVISGVIQPDEGTITYKGQERRFLSTLEAQAAGITIIHQELNLVPHLSVAENIFLAREPRRGPFVNRRKLVADAAQCLGRLGVDIDPNASVRSLSVAQQQMVEIAKALSTEAELLIMDEPTSSLTGSETMLLFKVIHDLKRAGVCIAYISHRLDELARIVDRVTVLRDGRYVSTHDFADTTVDNIVSLMVGRDLEDKFPPRTSVPEEHVLLHVAGLTRKGVFHDVSFTVRQGEILGFAGLMGAGRTEVARAVFGADPFDSGEVVFGGKTLSVRSPRDGIAEGLAYLSEDRKSTGLATKMSVASNLTLANTAGISDRLGVLDFKKEVEAARRQVERLDIRTPSIHQMVRLLSGGNQQKIIIGKWLFRQSRLLFFDEPTRGIDVGAKFAIYQIMDELAARGIGIVLISSELPEILGMTDRVAVFHQGRLARILTTRDTTQEEIMHYASGRAPSGPGPSGPSMAPEAAA